MTNGDASFWDGLSTDEAEFVRAIMGELADVAWAAALLRDINDNGGVVRANKARFFELRFGYALHQAGIAPAYEAAGEGQSTLDFGFSASGQDWLVELMRLEETTAVQRATTTETDEDGVVWSERVLGTTADDPRESPEGETIKAIERICQKFERNGQPHKFPLPGSAFHALLVDFRTFQNGGDVHDRIHVGLGGEYVTEEMARMYWDENLITGVFSSDTTLRGAAQVRERLHFLGFVSEENYEAGGLAAATQFIANPHLFENAEQVHAAIASWPLQRAPVLNGG